jgi:hypothetical protein
VTKKSNGLAALSISAWTRKQAIASGDHPHPRRKLPHRVPMEYYVRYDELSDAFPNFPLMTTLRCGRMALGQPNGPC